MTSVDKHFPLTRHGPLATLSTNRRHASHAPPVVCSMAGETLDPQTPFFLDTSMTPTLRLLLLFLAMILPSCGLFSELPDFKEIYCLQDQYVLDNFCTACPPGTTNAAGDFAGGEADTTCDPLLCADNQQVRSNRCFDCPVGTAASAGADASGPDTACAPVFCKQDQRVQDNACASCAQGTSNAAGDPTAGPDTACDGMLCLENQLVLSNVCTACPPGTNAPAGADAAGPDTTCTPVICPANHAVASNTCTPCAPGSQRDAGDDASGGDTSCNPVLCEVNERVQDNVCVACEGTDLNEPGDDASGADTSCVPFGYKQVSMGGSHTCAVTVTGGLKCWGSNAKGELGVGDLLDRLTPTDVKSLQSGVAEVSAGTYQTCALLINEDVKCWGSTIRIPEGADEPQNEEIVMVPQLLQLPGDIKIQSIMLSYLIGCFITDKNDLKCMSHYLPGSESENIIPGMILSLAEGVKVKQFEYDFSTSCVLSTLGGVTCSGSNRSGLLADDSLVESDEAVKD